MHNLVLGLDYTVGSLLIRAFLAVVLFLLLLGLLSGSLGIRLRLGLLCRLFLVGAHLAIYFFLQLGLLLVHVHVVYQLVVSLRSHSHELWFAAVALAVNVLHDLVIRAQFLLIRRHHSIHSIDRCVRHKFLEIGHDDKVGNVRVEYNIVSHANLAIDILVMLAFADSIGQPPRSSFFAIWLSNFLPLRFINRVMIAHIDKCLLVEELLLEVADHLLSERLNAESSIGLDKFGADRELAALLHLPEILIVLGSVLRVGDFVDIFAH